MLQKVIQIGNSLGIIVPKEEVSRLGLKKGSRVSVKLEEGAVDSASNEEVISAMKKVNERYGAALKKLSNL